MNKTRKAYMQSRREFLEILPVGLLGASCAAAFPAHAAPAPGAPVLVLSPAQCVYRPLDEVSVLGAGQGRLVVLDGEGAAYIDRDVTLPASFRLGGALGAQTVLFLNANRVLLGHASLYLDTQTWIRDESGEYQQLLDTLYWTMASDKCQSHRHNGRVYTSWDSWMLDNTNTLKGMRYFSPNVQSGFEIFSLTQREDGMIWENYLARTPPENDWDRRFKYGNFTRSVDDGFLELRRAPVENHVEMYFLEALYLVWKTTGDDAWMQQHLDHALRAVHYSTNDPYRWSKKFGLLKRGLTIDTWDYLCDSEAALVGGDAMVIDLEKTHFGVFFGDNTGMIAGCRNLAEMLDRAERIPDAKNMRELADQLEERLNRIAWNGRFYTHWVAEDPEFHPDLGVDMSTQVSLSNAYTLNRGIVLKKGQAIIRSYEAIRNEMPSSSPGEFYSIYPPFLKGFGSEQSIWDYVNGGVLACTAGELARGCFQHGRESYGVDILRRVHEITKRHRDFLPGILRGKEPERTSTHFTPLDLSTEANCDTGKGTADAPGWVNEPHNYLIDFPSGAQNFRGVPFQIADAGKNHGRACIGIARASRYAAAVKVSVGKSCRCFYLLHAASGRGSLFGKLTIHYQDGSQQAEYIQSGVNVGSYWAPVDSEYNDDYGTLKPERMQVAWRGSSELIANVGVWIASFKPDHDDVEIASIELESAENEAKWFVLGITLSDQPAFLPPWTDVSTGMPNNWGAGCVTAALLEGLAGVEDTGAGFRTAQISPRWIAADKKDVEVSVRYPASRGYVMYRYRRQNQAIILDCTSSAHAATLRVLLPSGHRAVRGVLDGKAIALRTEVVEESCYALVQLNTKGVYRLRIEISS